MAAAHPDLIPIILRNRYGHDYSYIESAAIRIGRDILEVSSFGAYALNGVEGALGPNGHSVPRIGGYNIFYEFANGKRHTFVVDIGINEDVTIVAFKEMVSIKILNGTNEHFGNVSGFMGTYHGRMLSRNGTNLRNNINSLAESWQVQEGEGNLFRMIRSPQAPEKCRLPDSVGKKSRRLGESLAKEAAKKACQHLKGQAFSFCVSDVLATGDLDLAQSGVY